jgi:hypothetical protein
MKQIGWMLFLTIAAARPALADCQSQLRLLAEDLKDVALTESQKSDLAAVVYEARRYCWVHQEIPAMGYIGKARKIAGIKPPADEFDWETVPLESLEQK